MNFKKLVTLGAALLTIGVMSTTGFAHHYYSNTARPAASNAKVAVTTQCNIDTCLVDGVCNGTCTGTGSCLGFDGCNSLCTGANNCITHGSCYGHTSYRGSYSGGRGGCHR